MKTSLPEWARSTDPYKGVGKNIKSFYREGRIVWGVFVIANEGLFRAENKEALPGMVIHSKSENDDYALAEIRQCAREIGELRDKEIKALPKDQRGIAAKIQDEFCDPVFYRVPRSLSQGLDLYMTAVLFFPKHLPCNSLDYRFFPLLIHPRHKGALMLPSFFWDKRLI